MSNVTMAGNVFTGFMDECFKIHGGRQHRLNAKHLRPIERQQPGNACNISHRQTPAERQHLGGSAGIDIDPFSPRSNLPPGLSSRTRQSRLHRRPLHGSFRRRLTTVTASCSVASVLSGDAIHFIRPMTGNTVSAT